MDYKILGLRKLQRLWMIFLILPIFVTCVQVDELSDSNAVVAFSVLSHTPEIIKLADAEIKENIIYIPVEYGKYNFPLRFYASVYIDGEYDQIVGLDVNEEQCLESIDDEIKFYVMAISGMTQPYTIKVRVLEEEDKDNNYIKESYTLSSLSQDVLYFDKSVSSMSEEGNKLTLFTVGGTYPMTIIPKLAIASGAEFVDFENGEVSMNFKSRENYHLVKVRSESGKIRYWQVYLNLLPILESGSEVVEKSTEFEPRETTVAHEIEGLYSDIIVDNKVSSLNIQYSQSESAMSRSAISFPMVFTLNLGMSGGVFVTGLEEGNKLTFVSESDQKKIYLFDPITSAAREWNITLQEVKLSGADVLGVSFDHTVGEITTSITCENLGSWWKPNYVITEELKAPCIKINSEDIDIYPKTGEIFIRNSDYRIEHASQHLVPIHYHNYKTPRDWRVDFTDLKFQFSEGSTVEGLPSDGKWSLISNYTPDNYGGDLASWVVIRHAVQNTCWNEGLNFKVTAQDGTTKNWTMKIRNPKETFVPSNLCKLENFEVASIDPYYAVFDPNPPVISEETKTITIKVLDADGCYPLSVRSNVELSPYASVISQELGQKPMVFEDAESIQTLTILAQDGETLEDWKVELEIALPVESADVELVQVIDQTESFTVSKSVVIDKVMGIITLVLEDAPQPLINTPLDVYLDIQVSDKAILEGISQRGEIRFNKMRDEVKFVVEAQNGESKKWKIRLDYAPQIPYSNLDSWSGITPNAPWSTANNSTVKGTSSEARNGGSAAVLKSMYVAGKFAAASIFLGHFEFEIFLGMRDPISLTHFGYPFQATRKIKGIEFDVNYAGGGTNRDMPISFDYGSCVVQLVDYNNKASDPSYGNFEYHGLYLDGGSPEKPNNARGIVTGTGYVANHEGNAQYNQIPFNKVDVGEWKTVFVPIDYKGATKMPDYTHLHVVFSCSALGDRFKGYTTTVMKVDNIKVIYE